MEQLPNYNEQTMFLAADYLEFYELGYPWEAFIWWNIFVFVFFHFFGKSYPIHEKKTMFMHFDDSTTLWYMQKYQMSLIVVYVCLSQRNNKIQKRRSTRINSNEHRV